MIITSAWSVFLIRPPRERGDEYKLAVMTLYTAAAATIHPQSIPSGISSSFPCLSYFSRNSLFALPNSNSKTPHNTQPAPRNIRNRQKKFDGNINKRGQVPIGKAAEHTDDPPISKGLIAFFMFVVIGSSIVQILRMFQTSVPNLSE